MAGEKTIRKIGKRLLNPASLKHGYGEQTRENLENYVMLLDKSLEKEKEIMHALAELKDNVNVLLNSRDTPEHKARQKAWKSLKELDKAVQDSDTEDKE